MCTVLHIVTPELLATESKSKSLSLLVAAATVDAEHTRRACVLAVVAGKPTQGKSGLRAWQAVHFHWLPPGLCVLRDGVPENHPAGPPCGCQTVWPPTVVFATQPPCWFRSAMTRGHPSVPSTASSPVAGMKKFPQKSSWPRGRIEAPVTSRRSTCWQTAVELKRARVAAVIEHPFPSGWPWMRPMRYVRRATIVPFFDGSAGV